LAAVGVPNELVLLRLLLVLGCLLKIPYRRSDLIYWCCAALGIVFTPIVFGVPLFLFGFLKLVVQIVNARLKTFEPAV